MGIKDEGDHMIGKVTIAPIGDGADKSFDLAANSTPVCAAIVIGILFTLFVTYILEFEDFKKRKDNALAQFDLRYAAALLASGVISFVVSYYVVFKGNISLFNNVEPFNAYLFIFIISAVFAFVIDKVIFHRVTDGLITIVRNKEKKAVLNQGLALTKDPETMAKITIKANALGLTDKQKIDKLGVLVSGVDDPSFAFYVKILLEQH